MLNQFFKSGTGLSSAPVDNDAWVYFIGGQSNAHGNSPLANLSAPLDGVIANSQIFYKTVSSTDNNATYSADNGSWGALEGGVNNQLTDWLAYYGPELKMAYDLQAYYGRTIYIVKFSIGDTSLHAEAANAVAGIGGQLDWCPGSINELFKKWMSDFWVQGRDKLIAAGKRPVPKGVLWAQGEHDSAVSLFSAQWGTNCRELRRQLREWTKTPDLHFCVARMPDTTIDSGSPNFRTHGQAVYDVQSVIGAETNCSWIDTNGFALNVDEAHFADHSELGAAAAAKFIAAMP